MGSVKLASPASLNDCLLRNVYRYRYAVVIDFDEVVVPRFHDDYEQMLAHIDRKYRLRDRAYTYTFSNTYFFLSFQPDVDQPPYLRTMRLRQRVPPTGVRSARRFAFYTHVHSRDFVRSFHQGRRLTVGSLSTCLQLPPSLRPRHGPVRNSPLTLRLVQHIYRA